MGVAWSGNNSAFQDFVDKYSLTFPQISDRPGDVFARFQVPVQPAIVIIAPDGSVQTLSGALDDKELDATLTKVTGAA